MRSVMENEENPIRVKNSIRQRSRNKKQLQKSQAKPHISSFRLLIKDKELALKFIRSQDMDVLKSLVFMSLIHVYRNIYMTVDECLNNARHSYIGFI